MPHLPELMLRPEGISFNARTIMRGLMLEKEAEWPNCVSWQEGY